MSGVNKAIIVGNLGQDPEVRETQTGQVVANLSVATNETWTDRDGERQERVEWHRVVVWGAVAEVCEQYLEKGRQVYVEGRIETREWEDKDGVKRYTTEIIASTVEFLGGPAGNERRGRGRDDREERPGRGARQSFERGAQRARGDAEDEPARRSGRRERAPAGRTGGRGGGRGGRAPWAARGDR